VVVVLHALHRRMAEAARERGSARAADRYETTGMENEEASRLIRELIDRLSRLTDGFGAGHAL